MTKPAKASISAQCDKMAGLSTDPGVHKELQKAR